MLPPVWCASHVVKWSVRSRRGRLGTGPGPLGMDAGLAVLPAAVPPVSLIPRARIHAVASPNRSSTLAAREAPVRAYRTRWLHCGFHQHDGRARRHCRERPPTESAHLHLHLHAVVAVPPLPHVPARSPDAHRLIAADQCLLLLGLGSELGGGFRAGGRAVNLGRKDASEPTGNRSSPCALAAWRRATAVYR